MLNSIGRHFGDFYRTKYQVFSHHDNGHFYDNIVMRVIMKKSLLVCLVFLSGAIWANKENLNAELMPQFTDSLYLGITTNNTAIVAVGERGHVAVSNDYGSTWQQSKQVPTRTTLTAVTMVGNNVWAVGHDTTIIHSADAGQTWQLQFSDVERQMPLLDVLFINESEGYAIGAYGTYLTTFNGGKSWQDGLISEEQDFHLNKIIKIDEFKLFAVAEAGNAYRSFDAGKNWEPIELPYSGSMFGVISLGNEILTYGLRGHVLISDNFGESFREINSPVQDSLFGSEIMNGNSAIIVGANGAMLKYANGQLSKVDVSGDDGDYTEILSVKDNNVIVIGESGISTKQIR